MKRERTTLHDPAKKLDIIASTVSYALKDHLRSSEATKKAILKTSKTLNYQPNHPAATFRNGRSKIISLAAEIFFEQIGVGKKSFVPTKTVSKTELIIR